MPTTLPARRSSALQPWLSGDPLLAIRQELDDVFGRLFPAGNGGMVIGGFSPALDLSETGDALYVCLDLPGITVGDVDIEVQDDQLVIRGERKEPEAGKDRSYHVAERGAGKFSRSLALPCSVKADKVEAAFHDGVLTITLPKAEAAKTRKIAIKAV